MPLFYINSSSLLFDRSRLSLPLYTPIWRFLLIAIGHAHVVVHTLMLFTINEQSYINITYINESAPPLLQHQLQPMHCSFARFPIFSMVCSHNLATDIKSLLPHLCLFGICLKTFHLDNPSFTLFWLCSQV